MELSPRSEAVIRRGLYEKHQRDIEAVMAGLSPSDVEASGAHLGVQVNGIHEVTGSIPVSSTNSSNDLEERPIR